MGKDKLPRIPSFAELGISEDEIEELEREIAEAVSERKRGEADKGEPARDRVDRAAAPAAPGDRSGAAPAPARAAKAPSSRGGSREDEAGRSEEAARAKKKVGWRERRRRAGQARKAARQRKARAVREAGAATHEDAGGAAEQAADSAPHPGAVPLGGLRGLLTLVVLLLTAWFSSSYRAVPAPVPASAPASEFSSARAMTHLVRIASEARPTGSPAHARVRDYLLDELRALGHDPEVHTATSFLAGSGVTVAARVQNVLARIPGSEPGGRAVLVTAHYDSRGISVGAGDDGSGVVTILEAVRALGERGQLRNDLIVLVTDAEELGLLGARAFVDEHPWLDDVALVLSFEMRGGGGPSMMFETGDDNGWVIEALRQADPYPSANSVSHEVYRRMRNDTDFTPFKEVGKQGLNFAALGRKHVYHQVYDTPGNFSEATLQHNGEHAVGLLEHFGNADLTTVNAPSVSYISIPLLGLVTYGTLWILVLGVGAVALWGLAFFVGRRSGSRTGAVVIGALGSVVYLGVVGGLAHYLVQWRSGAHPELGALHAGMFHAEGWYMLALAWVALALAAVVAGVLRRWLTAAELAVGALVVPVLLAGVATAMFPMGAMNLQWPVIAGCVGAMAVVGMQSGQRMGPWRWVLALLAAIPVVVVLTPLTEGVWAAMGLEMGAALAVLMGIGFIMLVPALEPLREPNAWWAPVATLVVGGAFLALGVRAATPSADRPAPSTLVYAMDTETGAAWWGTDPSRDPSDPGMAWAAAAVGPFAATGAVDSLVTFTRGQARYALAQAEPVAVAAPTVVVLGGVSGTTGDVGGSAGDVTDSVEAVAGSAGAATDVADSVSAPAADATAGSSRAPDSFRLSVTSGVGAEMMIFRFDDRVRPATVDGRVVPAGGRSTLLEHWGAGDAGVQLDFGRLAGSAPVRFTIVEHHLRPGELVGANRFVRPPELAPNIRTLSDRAMIRTVVSVDPATGEVRIEGAAAVGEQGGDAGEESDGAGVEGVPEGGAGEGEAEAVSAADTVRNP